LGLELFFSNVTASGAENLCEVMKLMKGLTKL